MGVGHSQPDRTGVILLPVRHRRTERSGQHAHR